MDQIIHSLSIEKIIFSQLCPYCEEWLGNKALSDSDSVSLFLEE